jgi:hypothetical protein
MLLKEGKEHMRIQQDQAWRMCSPSAWLSLS